MSDLSDHKRFEADEGLLKINSDWLEGLAEISVETPEQEQERLLRMKNMLGQFHSDNRPDASPWCEDGAQTAAIRARMLDLVNGGHPPVELQPWLKLKKLTHEQALPIIYGFCRELGTDEVSYVRLDGLKLFDDAAMASVDRKRVLQLRQDFRRRRDEVELVWGSFEFAPGRRPLSEYVTWARENEIEVEWLGWATANGYSEFFRPDNAANTAPDEEPLSIKERRSVLIIIAAICKASNIDLNAWGAAAQIADMVSKLGNGISMDPKTVSRYLKQIPDAVNSRGK